MPLTSRYHVAINLHVALAFITAASFLGPLYDKLPNPNFVLASGICLAGIGTAIVPLSTSVYVLSFVVMFQGIGMAVCDVGCECLLCVAHQSLTDTICYFLVYPCARVSHVLTLSHV